VNKLTLLAVTALAAVTYVTLADSPAKSQRALTEVSRKVIESSEVAGTDEELRLMLVEFPPGYSSAPHSHPVVGLCYVIEGTAESQYEGEAIMTIASGGSYQDKPNQVHALFRNVSASDPLRFLCAAKIKKGLPFLQPK